MERAFYKTIKPFIDENLSFIVNDDDKVLGGGAGHNKYSIIEKDGYNYEISRKVLGQLNNELIEYRIHKTIVPYNYINNCYVFTESLTESCWVHLKRCNGKMDINGYTKTKHKINICWLCLLCDPKTKRGCAFNAKNHNATAKHNKNVFFYNDNIKETLNKKKIGDDMVNEIMSYL